MVPCLNLSNPDVRRYVNTYGLSKTYTLYAQHDFSLPDFDAYSKNRIDRVLNSDEARQFLADRLDLTQFSLASLTGLTNLPAGTEAAFWQQTFYFGQSVTSGAVAEEAFHAIFQTLIPAQQRQQLLTVGQKLVKARLPRLGVASIADYYQQQKEALPETYGALSEADGLNRLYEEALAHEYVQYTTYGPLKEKSYRSTLIDKLTPYFGQKTTRFVQQVLDQLFSILDTLMGIVRKNRTYANLFFSAINRGDYKTAKIIEPGVLNIVPTTRIIRLFNGKPLSIREGQQLIRNLTHLVGQLGETDTFAEQTTPQQIEQALAIMADSLSSDPTTVDLADVLRPTRFDVDTFEEVPNGEYTAILSDVATYVDELRGVVGARSDDDLDEVGNLEAAAWDKEAWETGGWSGLSSWVKSYIASVGIPRLDTDGNPQYYRLQLPNQDYVDPVSGQAGVLSIPMLDIVDPDRVYYGLARAVTNTKSLTARLEKLLSYTSFSDTPGTSALTDQLLRDLAPTTYIRQEGVLAAFPELAHVQSPDELHRALDEFYPDLSTTTRQQLKQTGFTVYKETNPSLIREQLLHHLRAGTLDSYLSPMGKGILVKLLKGFDLWSRTMANMRVDPDTGYSVTSNANTNRASKNLFNSWKAAYPADRQALPTGKLATVISVDSLLQPGEKLGPFRRLPLEQQVARLDKAIADQIALNNQQLATLGIQLPMAYQFYSIYKNTAANEPELRDLLAQLPQASMATLFTVPAGLLATEATFGILNQYLTQTKYSPFQKSGDKDNLAKGQTGALTKLAEGAAFFDESAFDANYKNAEGKTVYSYQQKTYTLDFFSWFSETNLAHLTRLFQTGQRTKLRDEKTADGETRPVWVTEDSWTLKENWLLDKLLYDPFYKDQRSNIVGFTVDGIQQTQLERDDRSTNQFTSATPGAVAGEGVTYGELSAREFDLFNLNTLSVSTEWTKVVTDGSGKKRTLSPVYLGNRETAKTGEFLVLPLLDHLVQNETLSTEGETVILSEIQKEYERIRRVAKQLTFTQLTDKTARATLTSGDVFEKYHTGKNLLPIPVNRDGIDTTVFVPTSGNDYRALQFSDSVIGLLGDRQNRPTTDEPNNLVLAALLDQPFPTESLRPVLRQTVNRIIEQHLTRYQQEGVLELVDKSLTKQDIATKLVSDWVNNVAIGQLAYGDAALLFKNDGIDRFKRLKALNAAITSFSVPMAAPELGIDLPPTYYTKVILDEPVAFSDVTGEDISLADAQGWDSLLARRMSLYAQGKLSKPVSAILDSIGEGKRLTADQIRWLREKGIMLNSEKTVGADGQQYVKLSTSLLTKELTSFPIPITQAEYETQATLDRYGRTKQKPGSYEVSSYVQPKKGRVYYKWIPQQETKPLHEKRLILDGFRLIDGTWQYTGDHVQLITPLSASKTLSPNVYKGVNGQQIDWSGLETKHVNTIDLNYYGLQTANPSGKTKIVDPTQMLEIIGNELSAGDKVWFSDTFIDKNGVELLWQTYLSGRDKVNYDVAQQLFRDETDGLTLKPFMEKAYGSVVATGGDKQLTALFDPAGNYNPNLPLTRDKFVSLFFNHFTNEVLSHKRAGDSLTLVSSLGHQVIKRLYRNEGGYLDWEVIGKNHPDYNRLQQGKPLPSLQDYRYKHAFTLAPDGTKTRTEPATYTDKKENTVDSWFTKASELLENQSEVYVLDSLRHLKPRYEVVNGQLTTTGYFSESLFPVYDDRINTITPELRYSFGVRIPTQDKHSGLNIEWVDTLPVYMGSSLVTVKEVVELSGGDFDVDKEYVSRPDGWWQKGTFIPYGSEATPELGWQGYTHYVLSHYKSVKTAFKQLLQTPAYQSINEALKLQKTNDRQLTTDIERDYSDVDTDVLQLYSTLTTEELTADQQTLYQAAIQQAFTRFGLPGSVADWTKLSPDERQQVHVGWLNNNLLQLQQGMLANEKTIDDTDPDGGQYNTPATLTKLTELKETAQDGVTLFGDETGASLSHHWQLVHSSVHEKNGIGKSNIGVGVNNNLFLIKAVQFGFGIEPDFQIRLQDGNYHDGVYRDKLYSTTPTGAKGAVQTQNGKAIRVFDGISTLITANTDEAKEGLNAFFKLNTDTQGVVIHLHSQGYSLLDAITLVNMPVVQQYVNLLAQQKRANSGRGIVTATDTVFGDPLLTVLGINNEEGLLTRDSYTPDELRQRLATLKGKQTLEWTALDHQVLVDFKKTLDVVTWANQNVVPFIKLKKGFGGDLASFDKLKKAAELLFNPLIPSPMDAGTKLLSQPEKARQILQYTRSIVPGNDELQKHVFLQKHELFTKAFNQAAFDFSTAGENRERLTQSLETFVLTQLYTDLFTDGEVLAGKPTASLDLLYGTSGQSLLDSLNQFKETYGGEDGLFAGNPLLDLLITNTTRDGLGNVQLNTTVQLQIAQQEELLDGFRQLYMLPNQPLNESGVRVGEALAWQLMGYFVARSGWQFTMGNLSRVFSPEVFTGISDQLTELMANPRAELTSNQIDSFITGLGRQGAATELLNRLRIPGKKSIGYPLLTKGNVLTYETGTGQKAESASDILQLDFSGLSGVERFTLSKQMGLPVNEDTTDIRFPQFLRVRGWKTVYTGGERSSVAEEVTYELLTGGTQAATYVQVIPAGSPSVSPATGLGFYYTPTNWEKLQQKASSTTGMAKTYYTERIAEAWNNKPVVSTPTDNQIPADSPSSGTTPPDFQLPDPNCLL